VVSGLSTANTTNHAAPSNNQVLSKQQVVLISSTAVALIVGGIAAVIAFIAYRKRNMLRRQLGRLAPGETFSTAVRPIPRGRNLDSDDDAIADELSAPPAGTTINGDDDTARWGYVVDSPQKSKRQSTNDDHKAETDVAVQQHGDEVTYLGSSQHSVLTGVVLESHEVDPSMAFPRQNTTSSPLRQQHAMNVSEESSHALSVPRSAHAPYPHAQYVADVEEYTEVRER
jgi:hypothetical protein